PRPHAARVQGVPHVLVRPAPPAEPLWVTRVGRLTAQAAQPVVTVSRRRGERRRRVHAVSSSRRTGPRRAHRPPLVGSPWRAPPPSGPRPVGGARPSRATVCVSRHCGQRPHPPQPRLLTGHPPGDGGADGPAPAPSRRPSPTARGPAPAAA